MMETCMDTSNDVLTEEKNSILIVDDDALNITALTDMLGPDYKIFMAKDGKEAIEAAKELRPDLILLDIVMPEMDGHQVITALKRMDETREIPIIFLTGLENAVAEEVSLVLGAADYITKPYVPELIKLRIQNQMQIVNQMRVIYHLSITDELTQMSNRNYFNERMAQDWQRAVRESKWISILMIDVDNFKSYNDAYGHLQGDIVLQAVAEILKKHAKRATDMAARWGGEEFVMVLPNTGAAGAALLAENIRKDVEKMTITRKEGNKAQITVSIGINSVMPDGKSAMNLFISDADKALYRAKESGRNKVCVAGV